MRLFSEKVTPTFTSSNQNILIIKDYTEIFFDVFELEINGNKYIAEKVSEYKGNPVVNIPIVIEGKELEAPFVIQRGRFEVIFNEFNSTFIGTTSKPKEVLEEFKNEAEEVEEIIFEKKESILKEIKQARKLAGEFAESVKQQNLREVKEAKYQEREVFFKSKEKFKKDLLDEFLQLTENTRDELFTYTEQESEKAYDFIVESINSLSDKLTQDLESTIQDQNTQSVELFENRISELAKNILTNNLIKEIESRDTTNNKNLDVKFETVSKSLTKVLGDWEANVTGSVQVVVSKLDSTILSLEQTNVELNDSIIKNSNKALSRIGNVKTQLEESIASNISSLATKIDATDASVRVIEGIVNTVDVNVSKIHADVKDTLDVVNDSIVSTESKINDIQANVQHTLSNVNDSIVTVESKIDDLSVDTQSKIGLLEDNISIFQNSSTIVEKTINDFKGSTLTLQQNVDTLKLSVDNTVKKLTSNVENKIIINNTTLKESLDNTVRDLTSDLENKITIAEGKITSYYDDRITLIESSVTDITTRDKAHIIEIIEQSKKSILDEVSLIKNSVPSIVVEKTLETKGDVDVKTIKTDLEKSISNRFNLELANVRRIIELSSGGGSVAVQFANGGIMRGNLNVTGQILSAGVDLATIFSGGGGGSGDAAVNALVHSTSGNWNSAYTSTTALNLSSSLWNNTYTTVKTTSGNWNSAYNELSSRPYTLVDATSSIKPIRGNNTASGNNSNVAGGSINRANGHYSTVGGGLSNIAGGLCSNIGGGYCNTANGHYSNVAGGFCNAVNSSGVYSNVAGGRNNTVSAPYSTIAGGKCNTASSYWSNVGGGYCNTASGAYSNIGGGRSNSTNSDYGFIGGGCCNTASSCHAVIVGGIGNTTVSNYNDAFIGGGRGNTASGYYAPTIVGGINNTASGHYPSLVVGGIGNEASGSCSSIIGGSNNKASGESSFIGGGGGNKACNLYSTIIGGNSNTASGEYNSFVGIGFCNTASARYSTVINGTCNTASSCYSTIIGGRFNTASGSYSTASGYCNTASASYSTILNGNNNCICNTAACSSIIAGGNITALSANTAYAPTLALTNVPTSSVGLGSGFIWRSTITNQLFIVP